MSPSTQDRLPFAQALFAFDESAPSGTEKLDLCQSFRAQSDDAGQRLDRFFIDQMQAFGKVRDTIAKLKKIVTKLSAPPWLEGIFIRLESTTQGLMAVVSHSGQNRLVQLAEELDCREFAKGDVVFLSDGLNVVLGKATYELSRLGETATVESVLPDGRLMISDRDTMIVVEAAGRALEADPKPGDRVLWHSDLRLATELIDPQAPKGLILEEVSDVSSACLAGMDAKLNRIIDRFTMSIADAVTAALYGIGGNKSLLLYGPPGCGKTTIMRIVASEIAKLSGKACKIAIVRGAELESPWVGTGQQNIKALFKTLNEVDGPTILFIDEVEAIGRVRGHPAGHHSDTFLSSWLAELDGFTQRKGVGVIAATNRKDMLDQAFYERIAGMEVRIGRPNMEACRAIFDIHLPESLPFRPNGPAARSTRDDIIECAAARLYLPNGNNELAVLRFRDGKSRTVFAKELVSGRLISQIAETARESAFLRHASGGEAGLILADIEDAVDQALERLSATLSPVNARSYLEDLPQNVDVVAVEPVQQRIRPHRYLA